MYLNRWHLQQARSCLLDGGLIGYATEGVFGFGCDPLNDTALAKLRQLKSRSKNKGFILVADKPERLRGYVALDTTQLNSLINTDDKPTTWLVEKGPLISDLITGNFTTVAVRICLHPQVQALSKLANMPIISTSANYANQEPAMTFSQLKLQFSNDLDYLLPGRTLGFKQPSQIIDFKTQKKVR